MQYIGTDMQERMDLLGLTAKQVAERAFMEENDINLIINNKVALDDIDEFDISLICNILHCKPEYFTDTMVKSKDLLVAAMNRGNDNEISIGVKAKIQDFLNDFAFVKEVLAER